MEYRAERTELPAEPAFSADGAETLEQRLLHQEEQLLSGGSTAELIALYNQMGTFYRQVGRYGKSVLAFQQAREKIAGCCGTECIEYATVLNNMAGTYRLARQYDQAISLYREAIDQYCFMSQEDDYAYASVHSNLSLVYQETGQIDFAIYHLEKALMLIRALPEHREELAVTYSNLTTLYYQAGRTEKAMRCLEKALHLFAECGGRENPHHGAALSSLAGFLYSVKEFRRAAEVYQKAAEYTKRFYGETLEYAVICQNMNWVYKELRQRKRAVQVLGEAERVYAALLGPKHERTCTVREELRRVKSEVDREKQERH